MGDMDIFGPIHERNVVFLIDTSGSMYFCLRSVQENLIEALFGLRDRQDCSFNIIEFNRKVNAWANQCVPCNTETVKAAARWVQTREASVGNNLPEAILMAFEDRNCEAVYVISNSLPVERKAEVIDDTLFIANGRPVHSIYLASDLSDPAAEKFLGELAWETRGSFKVLEVSQNGRFQQASLVFDCDERYIRATSGRLYPREKYCSATGDMPPLPPPLETLPPDICLPWKSQFNPVWWSRESTQHTKGRDTLPLTRYHTARAFLRGDEIHDAVMGAPVVPGIGLLLIDKKVLARRIEDGNYYLGRVKSEVGRDRFLVQFEELNKGKYRSTVFQEIWIYDIISAVDAFRHSIVPGDNVLVPVENGKYAPAVVLQGREQRNDPTPIRDHPLIVNHLDGRSETLDFGVAIWIPAKLFDRISFELKLPVAARKTLECQIGYPESDLPVTEEYVEVCSEEESVGDVECEEVLVEDNPYQDRAYSKKYYENLYSRWPWWWKMWYNRYPVQVPVCKPKVVRRTKVVKPPRHVRMRRVPAYVETEDKCFTCEEVPQDNNFYYTVSQRDAYEDDQEESPATFIEDPQFLRRKRAVSPVRLVYSDESGTQTNQADLRRSQSYTVQRRGEERPPWRYWRTEEPPPPPFGETRASSPPARRVYEMRERMDSGDRRRDEQRWFEAEYQKRAGDGNPRNVDFIRHERFERREESRPYSHKPVYEYRDPEFDRRRDEYQPYGFKPEPEYVDYVGRDRAVAERSRLFEPRPRHRCSRQHRHHHGSHRHHHQYYSPERHQFDARKSTYQDDYMRDQSPVYDEPIRPAGLPSLTAEGQYDMSRQSQYMAAEDEQERRHSDRRRQDRRSRDDIERRHEANKTRSNDGQRGSTQAERRQESDVEQPEENPVQDGDEGQ